MDLPTSFSASLSVFLMIFFTIGLLIILFQTIIFLRFLYRHIIRPRKNLISRYGSNSWAFITGASDGIGKGFSLELAKTGFNICLVARTLEKLKEFELEINNKYPKVSTKIIVADFSKSLEPNFFYNLENEFKNLEISILINNVGYGDVDYFEKISPEKIKDSLIINFSPAIFLSKLIIPKMLERIKKSAIINMASFSCTRPIPYSTTYGATKRFLDFFSKSLDIELSDKIDFLSLRPSWVSTPLSKKEKNGFSVISVEEFVNAGLDCLGYQRDSYGSWKHGIIEWASNNLISDKSMKKKAVFTIKNRK